MLGRILVSCNPTFVLVGITVVTYQVEYIGYRDSATFDGAKAFLEIHNLRRVCANWVEEHIQMSVRNDSQRFSAIDAEVRNSTSRPIIT